MSRDLLALRDILHLTSPPEGLSPTESLYGVLEHLERLLACDRVSFQVFDCLRWDFHYCQTAGEGDREVAFAEELAAERDAPGMDIFHAHWWTMPCSLPERSGRPTVTSIRSVLGQREWAEHPTHKEYLFLADEALLAYPLGQGRALRILAPRFDGLPFGTRELTLLTLLLPHLRGLLATVFSPPEAVARRLTERQVHILRMVQLGMSNRQIARNLLLAEGTVRKHLENAFARLGVYNRTEAVCAAFGPAQPTG